MAICINRVTLLGKVGRDPEVKSLPNGSEIASLTLLTLERYKDKAGESQDRVESHSITAFQNLAKIVGTYVRKGHRLYVEGRLYTRSWDDAQSGKRVFRTDVIANDLVLLTESPESARRRNQDDSRGRAALENRNGWPPPNNPPPNGEHSSPRSYGHDSPPGHRNQVQPARVNGMAGETDNDSSRSMNRPG